MHRIFWRVCLALVALWTAPHPAAAVDPMQQNNSNAVWFENWIGLSNATMVVAAPDGAITQIYAASGTPVFQLDRANAPDGVWHYELRAATEERLTLRNPLPNGRGATAQDSIAKPFYRTGFFVVSRGAVIRPEDIQEEDG